MKKLLLSLATVALAAGFTVSADTATWNFDQEDAYGFSTQKEGSTFETKITKLEQGDITLEFSGNYRLWDRTSGGNHADYQLRLNKNSGKVVISAANGATISSIAFTGQYTNSGTLSPEGEESGSAAAATYTFTNNPTSVSVSAGSSNNICLTGLTVAYEPAPVGDKERAGLSFPKSAYTAALGSYFTAPTLSNPNNLAVTFTSSNPEVADVTDWGGTFGQMYSIKAVGTTTITATSAETDTFAAGTASFTLTVVDGAATIAQMEEKAPNANDKIFVTGDLDVVWFGKSGNNCYVYVTDRNYDSTLLFGYNLDYKIGDVLQGPWEAQYSPYNGLPEWKFVSEPTLAQYSSFPQYPAVESVTADDVNRVVMFKGVEITEATPSAKSNYDVTIGETTYQFRNNFNLESVDPGTYDILVAVALYNGAVQIYPLEFNKPSNDPVFPETMSVSSVDGEAHCTFEYTQGMGWDFIIEVESAKDQAAITIDMPEGWDTIYLYMYPDYDEGDYGGFDDFFAPRKVASELIPAEYIGLSALENNTFTVKTGDGKEAKEGVMYLGYNGLVDAANNITVYVIAKKSEGTSAVESVEIAKGEAEYYNLQGVKVANPEKGVYVKVLNGKAEKVVLK